MMVGAEPTIMNSKESSISTGAAPNLVNANVVRLQWNSDIMLQDTLRIRAARK